MKTLSTSSTPNATITAAIGSPTIRAASTDIGILDQLTNATTVNELLPLLRRSSLLFTELNTFHPEVVDQIRCIVNGTESRPKVIRKTIRTLCGLISRSAARATPSRLIGSVGNISPSCSATSEKLVLDTVGTITASVPAVPTSSTETHGTTLRWNPSAVIMDGRCYITAPRRPTTKSFSSVGVNSLIRAIRSWAREPITGDELRNTVHHTYPDANTAAIEKVLHQLIDHEVLLAEDDIGYHTYRSRRCVMRENITLDSGAPRLPDIDHLIDHDVDLYRDATGSVPKGMEAELRDYLNHGLHYGAFDYNDTGIAEIFAQLMLEKYGAARVPLPHLLHPVFGLDWRKVKASHGARSSGGRQPSAYQRAVYTRGIRNTDGWVDLRKESKTLPVVDRQYSGLDSLDLIASVHGTEHDSIYSVADSISSMPGGVSTARFDLFEHGPVADDHAVNIDWVSPQQAFNSVREYRTVFPRTINISSVECHPGELTLDSLQMWSDGTRVHLCDKDGIPIQFRPTSMAGAGAYPEWMMQIAMAAT